MFVILSAAQRSQDFQGVARDLLKDLLRETKSLWSVQGDLIMMGKYTWTDVALMNFHSSPYIKEKYRGALRDLTNFSRNVIGHAHENDLLIQKTRAEYEYPLRETSNFLARSRYKP